MSQIEIDKSKKVFDNISMSKELSKIRQMPYIRYIEEKDKFNQMAKKMIVPRFFSMISDFNEYRIFEKFNTPLDILQDVLVFENAKYQRGEKNKELQDLLVQTKELNGVYQTWAIKTIFEIVEECGKRINGLKLKTCTLNDKAKKTVERKAKKDAIEKIKKITPSEVTVLNILKQCFGQKDNYGFKKYGMLTLNLLFMSKKVEVLRCFRSEDTNFDEVLVKIKDNYDYDIFGNKYQKVNKKEL